MAAILEAAVAYFRSSSMVNSITAVQWMDTGRNGVPPPMISLKTESGDCVSISEKLFRPEYFSRAFSLVFFCPVFCVPNGMDL